MPERDGTPPRLGLQRDVLEPEVLVPVGHVILAHHAPEDLDVAPEKGVPVGAAQAHGGELVVEVPDAEPEDQPRPEELGHGGDDLRGDERVTERDQRRGAQPDPRRHRADGGERGEGLVEGPIGPLELAVRLVHQMVADPQGVERQRLGAPGAGQQLVGVRLLTEVREQEPVLRHAPRP